MKKQDIIRIINEEIEFALEEQEKQLYKVVDDKGKTIKPDESSDVDGLIKKIATKLAAKNPKWSIEKINEMYDPIYDSMIPEIAVMLMAGMAGVIKAVKYLKSKGLNKQAIVDVIKKAKSQMKDNVNEPTKPLIVVYDGKRLAIEPEDLERLKSGKDIVGKNLEYAGQEEWIYAKGDWKIEEPINENEGKEKEYTVVYDKLNRSDEEYEKYEETVNASSKEEAIKKVKGRDPRGKRHKIK